MEVVSCMGKAMVDEVNFYKHESEEYKEYIELWIHEVKLPIAAGRLIVENNRNPVTQSLEEELEKIEAYTEQALFYARSAQVEKDYQIGRVLLRDVVSQVVKRNKRELIALHTSISMEGLDVTVYSDGKWLAFILNQLVSNSIKYADKEHLELSFLAEECPEQIVLTIRDNGQGIADRDLPRIFEKGFTGSAVRESRKSTGIGLYLCEKLCKKLGHAIEAESKEGEGVSIRLIFPRGSFNLQN